MALFAGPIDKAPASAVAAAKVPPVTPPALSAGEPEFDVLRAFWAQRAALTRRQLEVRTGLAAEDVGLALEHLCLAGRLNRLNTLVESYCLPGTGAIIH